VQVGASGTTIQRYLQTGDQAALYAYMRGIHRDAGFDFLSLTDASGRVVLRVSRAGDSGGDASAIGEVKAALAGKVAAPQLQLQSRNGHLSASDEQALERFVS